MLAFENTFVTSMVVVFNYKQPFTAFVSCSHPIHLASLTVNVILYGKDFEKKNNSESTIIKFFPIKMPSTRSTIIRLIYVNN